MIVAHRMFELVIPNSLLEYVVFEAWNLVSAQLRLLVMLVCTKTNESLSLVLTIHADTSVGSERMVSGLHCACLQSSHKLEPRVVD